MVVIFSHKHSFQFKSQVVFTSSDFFILNLITMEYNISDKGELGYVIKLVGAAFHKRPKHYFEGIPKRRFINRAKFFIHPILNNTTPFSCN